MKITKLKHTHEAVKSSQDLLLDTGCFDSNYFDCINHIRDAIKCLCLNCENDPVAKESIANLSVVLFDLQQLNDDTSVPHIDTNGELSN